MPRSEAEKAAIIAVILRMASLTVYENAQRQALEEDDPVAYLELLAKKSIADDIGGGKQSFYDTMLESLTVLTVAFDKMQPAK